MNAVRWSNAGRWLVALALLAPVHACAGSAPETPGRHWEAYRTPADTVAMAAKDVAAIYETALRFYQPPRNQVRRLDVRLLPASAGDTAGTLDPSLATALVKRLGDRFSLLSDTPPQVMSGDLRMSEIYASSPNRARVVVGCQMTWPIGPTTDNGAQAFEIVRGPKGWKIADRGGVETPR